MPQVDQAEPDPLFIYYPNGSVMGVALFVWDAAENKYVKWDGSGGGGGGGAVTIADGADVTQGALADPKVVGDNAGSLSAKLRGINTALLTQATAAKQDTGNTSLASIDTKTPALGQALAAASVPVVLTAAQITTLTPPAAITGFATETTLAATLATQGATTGAAVITDANGTIQQYLRGLVKLAITAGSFLVTAALSAGTNLIGYVGGKNTYAAKATITITLTSLTNTSSRESTVIDNTTNRYRDVLIRIQSKGQTSGTGVCNIYVYEALGDTTYTDLASGSDAAFTTANRFNSRFLGAMRFNAGTSAVIAAFKLSDIFNTVPDKWGLIVDNETGATLSATGGDHVVEYEGIY